MTISQEPCAPGVQGMEGYEMEELYNHYRELNQAARAKKPSESH